MSAEWPVCRGCGTPVLREALARWNRDRESWEIDSVQDSYWCDRCGPVSGPPRWANDAPLICGACNGSGEGMHDGAICSECRGKGEVLPEGGDEW